MKYDAVRTRELEGAGIRLLRIWNGDLFKNTEAVLEAIYKELFTPSSGLRPPSPSGRRDDFQPAPLREGGGGEGEEAESSENYLEGLAIS